MFPNPFTSIIGKYNIRWLFDECNKTKLEELLSVNFVKIDHYYVLDGYYTYIELFLGLNEIDLTMYKTKNTVEIIIKNV